MKLGLAVLLAAALLPLRLMADGRRSGFEDMSPATQAMQRDDSLNPGMLWVLQGEQAWTQPVGVAGGSCAGCHGAAKQSMRGVAARYPAFDAALRRPIDLPQRIDLCRQRLQSGTPADADATLALLTYVAQQSRGLPIAPPDDARLQGPRERGRALWGQRMGQLDLACSDCHDALAGRRLGGSPIPQGHPTGYPIYRLQWQGLGSLQRRLRACLVGVRAEPFAWGAPEWIELELFLAWRARGMLLESPAVRP
jgi:sulfur-oxidizing protein SoxA